MRSGKRMSFQFIVLFCAAFVCACLCSGAAFCKSVAGHGQGSAWYASLTDAGPHGGLSSALAALEKRLARAWQGRLDARDFGAKGDGKADDTQAVQRAINAAAAQGKACHFPSGTYIVSGTMRIPSNSRVCGDGMERTVIRMSGKVQNAYVSLFMTGWRNEPRENILLEDLTLDFNRARTAPGPFPPYCSEKDNAGRGTCLAIINTRHCLVRNVRCLNGLMYCIDIASPSYRQYFDRNEGTQKGWDAGRALTYDTDGCEDVWLVGCHASGGGDDNITTHFSRDVRIIGCVSENPSGIYTKNSNCFEIDDGSSRVFLKNCVARGGRSGLQVKGHQCCPCARDVVVDGMRIYGSANPVFLGHLKWYGRHGSGPAHGFLTADKGHASFGESATAKNVALNNISIHAPKKFTSRLFNSSSSYAIPVESCIDIRSFANVSLSNVTIDGKGGDEVRLYPFMVSCNARNISCSNITVRNFERTKRGYLMAFTYRGGKTRLPCGGGHRLENVALHTKGHGIYAGYGRNISISNVSVHATGRQSDCIGIDADRNAAVRIRNLTTSGVRTPVRRADAGMNGRAL